MQVFKRYLIFAFILLLLGIINESFYKNELVSNREIVQFQEALNNKIYNLQDLLQNIEVTENSGHSFFQNDLPKGFNLLAFNKHNDLIGWTDNSFSIDQSFLNQNFTDTVCYLQNSYHYVIRKNTDSVDYMALFLLKYSYPYENDFLHNGFINSFKLPSETRISFDKSEGGYPVFKNKDTVLFYLLVPKVVKDLSVKKLLSLVCYLLALITFLYSFYYLIVNLKTNALTTILILMLFLGFRLLMQWAQFPTIWYNLPLFSPNIYADSILNPNLGDYLISGIFMVFTALVLYQKNFKNFQKRFYLKLSAFLLILFLFLSVFLYSTYSLVVHSSISFETHKVSGLNIYSFVGVLLLLIQGFSFVLIAIRIFRELRKHRVSIKIQGIFLLSMLVFLIISYIILEFPLVSLFLVLIIFGISYFHSSGTRNWFDFTTISVYIFFLSIVITINLFHFQKVNEKYKKELIAVNLAYEHDPVAELLLSDVGRNIQADKELSKRIFDTEYTWDDIIEYIMKNYFTGFFNKYEVNVTFCSGNDSIQITNWVPCRQFFQHFIDSNGLSVDDEENFYFLDNLNGRISYIGKFYFNSGYETYTLFIELDSKLTNLQIGYPRLLLKEENTQKATLTEYSYAKYHQDKLFTQAGEYPYTLEHTSQHHSQGKHFIDNGFHHYRFVVDADNEIIVSKKAATLFEQAILFSYIFVLNYLILIIVFLVVRRSNLQPNIGISFQNRIQFTVVGLLVLSLIFIGGGAIYFSINQYTNKHYEILNEKIQSVNIELVHKLSMEDELDETWYSEKYGYLDQLLIKFSDVFYSDINLYYPDGRLMAASRREVFDIGLSGTYMNPEAFEKMAKEKQAQFIHQEQIGSLTYYSAYIPFTNYENKLLAYLNLPYFTKQDALRNEITNLAVAILNIFVLLTLLTISAAFFISRQITQPLQRIQERMQQIKLNKKNEPIEYDRNDEIGQLVRQYNNMLNELERSVELLAKSEREGAWREMAKQVAHEIKNPLTPMKLTIQHLQRTWKEHRNDPDYNIDQLANTLIEQIDNLSSIANAFSNFAKMPEIKLIDVDLTEVLRNVILIYQSEKDILIQSEIPDVPLIISSDREQLHSAFSNIIKNAIQAIPKNKKGLISVVCRKEGQFVHVEISDNGKGISEEISEKLFIPNFTTKSSGMGIGLSIAKSVIEMSEGDISFQTKINEGTSFKLIFPLNNIS